MAADSTTYDPTTAGPQVEIQVLRIGENIIPHFEVLRSVDLNFNPPEGYKHLFFCLNTTAKCPAWVGLQVPVSTEHHAKDIHVLGLTGYADNPLSPAWTAMAEHFRQENVRAVFPIYAHHLGSPEVLAATRQQFPETQHLPDSEILDRDGNRGNQRGLFDYLNESLFVKKLYEELLGGKPHPGHLYIPAHSLGSVATAMYTMYSGDDKIAGLFLYGFVAGFSHPFSGVQHPDSGFVYHSEELGDLPPGFGGRSLTKRGNLENHKAGQSVRTQIGKFVPGEIVFNPEYMRQYMQANILALVRKQPGLFSRIASLITMVIGEGDIIARLEHLEKLHKNYSETGISLFKIPDADHSAIQSRAAAKTGGEYDKLDEFMAHLTADFGRKRASLLTAKS